MDLHLLISSHFHTVAEKKIFEHIHLEILITLYVYYICMYNDQSTWDSNLVKSQTPFLDCCPILSGLDPSSMTLGLGPNNLLNLGSVPRALIQFFLGSPTGLQLLSVQESASVPAVLCSDSCFYRPWGNALAPAGLRFWDLCNMTALPSLSGTGAFSAGN